MSRPLAQRDNLHYSGEHCSQCGYYVGPNRWGEYPEYGSHGCLWGDARVVVLKEDAGEPPDDHA